MTVLLIMIGLADVLINGLAAGAVIALVAYGFGIIHKVSGFFPLSHAAVLSMTGYVAYYLMRVNGVPSALSVSLAIAFGGVIGVLLDVMIYRPLSLRGASPTALLLASIGVYTVVLNCISVLTSDKLLLFGSSEPQVRLSLLGVGILKSQLVSIGVGISACLAVLLIIRSTNFGRNFRAMADNPELAAIVGINVGLVRNFSWAVGSVLAGLAAVVNAYDVNLVPSAGFRLLLPGATAYILAGGGRVEGAIIGAVLMGVLVNFAGWWLPSQWQDTVVFMVLLLGLLLLKDRRNS